MGCGIAIPRMLRMRDIDGTPDKAHLIPTKYCDSRSWPRLRADNHSNQRHELRVGKDNGVDGGEGDSNGVDGGEGDIGVDGARGTAALTESEGDNAALTEAKRGQRR
ncbi:hypothetical protein Syun_004420 [Stephania yunnanensis]|uniref:Uncharacterized protein n=1 Tax=Stephania yunnanensis TaxID=152371 RepID=A0AAP0L4D4_9MAGN